MQLFHDVSQHCSRITTSSYSSSFSSAIKLLHNDLQAPVYNIYGFVRFADEIVDSFHEFDKKTLLQLFKTETFYALENKISLNPILNSFQLTANKYKIDRTLIEAFFRSMEFDLEKKGYDINSYQEYIYGSAEVVGLMCLQVFCEGDKTGYEKLKPAAQALGSAFQKVNFLRDVKADYQQLERIYFPGVDFNNFTASSKKIIEADIEADFEKAWQGMLALPVKARLGVYVAYKYYRSLFSKIKRSNPAILISGRIRIASLSKAFIVMQAGLRSQFNLL